MTEYSEKFLKYTIEVWQPLYGTKILTLEDAKEIATNMLNLIEVLDEIEKKYEGNE